MTVKDPFKNLRTWMKKNRLSGRILFDMDDRGYSDSHRTFFDCSPEDTNIGKDTFHDSPPYALEEGLKVIFHDMDLQGESETVFSVKTITDVVTTKSEIVDRLTTNGCHNCSFK